jgi:hypothetical protein
MVWSPFLNSRYVAIMSFCFAPVGISEALALCHLAKNNRNPDVVGFRGET